MDPGSLSVLVDTLKIDGGDIGDQSSVGPDLDETRCNSEPKANVLDLLHPSVLPDLYPHNDHFFLEVRGPITPDSLGRSCPCLPHHFASPPSLTKPAPTNYQSDACPPSGNVCTPKGSIFDPIAPRPYAFLLYPHCKQCTLEDSPSNVVRSLNFDCCASLIDPAAHEVDAETNISDEELLSQTIYRIVLEEIFLMQTKGLPVSVGFETPATAPHLGSIAETCPPAPVKPSRKLRDTHKNLCRKLEF